MPQLTTGMFPVPPSEDGTLPVPPLSLTVAASDFGPAGDGDQISFQVNQLVDGGKQTVLEGTLAVPAGGVAQVTLDIARFGGSFLKVTLQLPEGSDLVPSATVFTTAAADLGNTIVWYFAPGEFVSTGALSA